jgi:hypothetical protein
MTIRNGQSLRADRPGYTLLEVLVAFAIGVFVLGGLYYAIDIQLRHAQIARDEIEQASLARSLCERIEGDVQRSLGPLDAARLDPLLNPSTSSSTQGGTASTGGTATGGTTTGNTMRGATGGGTGGARTTPTVGRGGGSRATGQRGTSTSKGSGSGSSTWTVLDSNSMPTSVVSCNLMMQGTTSSLVLYVSRAPRLYSTTDGTSTTGLAPNNNQGMNGAGSNGSGTTSQDMLQLQQTTDIRQITYQMGTGPDGTPGLVRQEVLMTQADDGTGNMLQNLGQDVPFQLLSSEVQDIQFRYLDNNSQTGDNGWVENWPSDASDVTAGTVPTYTTGGSPLGPPLAIEITLRIRPKSSGADDGDADLTYRHVIPILAANGPSLQTLGQQLSQGGNSQATGANGQAVGGTGQ